MNDVSIVCPLCETIELLLTESENGNAETRVALILQTQTFLVDIASLTNSKFAERDKLVKTVGLFLDSIARDMPTFLGNDEHAQKVSVVLGVYINSDFALFLSRDISVFMVSLIYSSERVSVAYYSMIGYFLGSKVFVPAFEENGGLFAIWSLLGRAEANELCNIVFAELSNTIHLYGKRDMTPMLEDITRTFSDVVVENAVLAFQFIFDLLSNANCVANFSKIGGIAAMNEFILKHDDVQLLCAYQMFRSFCVGAEEEARVVINGVMELLERKDMSGAMRRESMRILQSMIKQCDVKVIDGDELCLVVRWVDQGDYDCVLMALDVARSVVDRFGIDVSVVVPSLLKLCSFDFAMTKDMSTLVELLVRLGDNFMAFGETLSMTLMRGLSAKQFVELVGKYKMMFPLLEYSSSDIEFVKLFFESGEMLNDTSQYRIVFRKIIENDSNLSLLLCHMTSWLMKELTLACEASRTLRSRIKSLDTLELMKEQEPVLVFDLIVAVSGKYFDRAFDEQVAKFAEGTDFMGMTEVSIKKLAFGVYQDVTEDGKLCFPSILYKCGEFVIKSPFDMCICGKFGIDRWIAKTGKTIDQFPSISQIAQRYVMPRHVSLILQCTKLLCECCTDSFGTIPLFEFAAGHSDTEISIPSPEGDKNVGFCFWLMFEQYTPSNQNICEFMGVKVSVTGDEIFVNESVACEFSLNRRYLLTVTAVDRKSVSVYLGTRRLLNVPSTERRTIVVGARRNIATWYVMGAIRCCNSVITEQHIERVLAKPIHDCVKMFEREKRTVSPYSFVDMFEGVCYNMEWLSENSRPVISCPTVVHLMNSYRGAAAIYQMIIERLSSDIKGAQDLLVCLISVHQLGFSSWQPNVLAVRLSCLFDMAPGVFTVDSLSDAIMCFIDGETVSWDAALTFLCDYSLFNSEFRGCVVSKLFELVAMSPPKLVSNWLFTFICRVIILIECEDDDIDAMIALITKIDVGMEIVGEMLAALPSFVDNLRIRDFHYKAEFSPARLSGVLIERVNRNASAFRHWPLTYALSVDDSFHLIASVMSHDIFFDRGIDAAFIMRYCLWHHNRSDAWTCAVSLVGRKYVTDMANARFEKLDEILVPTFLVMVSMLSIEVITADNDMLKGLWDSVLCLLYAMVPCLTDVLSTTEFLAAALGLLTFGSVDDTSCLFPFAPGITSVSDIVGYTMSRGQQFPVGVASGRGLAREIPFQACIARTEELILETVPEKRFIGPPQLGTCISVRMKIMTPEIIQEAVAVNTVSEPLTWKAFVKSGNLPLEVLKQSSIVDDIVVFLASMSVRGVESSKSKKKIVKALVSGHSLVSPALQLWISERFVTAILRDLIGQKKRSPFVAELVSKKIIEGWYTSSAVDIMIMVLGIDGAETSPFVKQALISLFDVVHLDQLPRLPELFTKHKDRMFRDNDVNFVVLLYTKAREHEMEVIIDLIHEQVMGDSFNSIIADIESGNVSAVDERLDIAARLTEKLMRFRMKITEMFALETGRLLDIVIADYVGSHAVCSCIRYYEGEMLLFDYSHFMRIRERQITGNQLAFKSRLSERKTLSLLNDPVYPTRKLDNSPIVFKVPPFPAKNITDIAVRLDLVLQEMIGMPDLFRDITWAEFMPFGIMAQHMQCHETLAFSTNVKMTDILLLSLLELVLNKGDAFEFVLPGGLLYGLEPVSGLLLKTDDHLIFVEGLERTHQGVKASNKIMQYEIFCFYMSYFISGYFGPCFFFGSHPVIQFTLTDIISSRRHYWLQKPYSVEINCRDGYTGILITETKAHFRRLKSIVEKIQEANFQRFPPRSASLSPFNSARLLRSSANNLTKKWSNGVIDNYTYLCLLNKMSGRSVVDFSQYFVFPWTVTDFTTDDLGNVPTEAYRDLSLPMGQIGTERAIGFDSIFEESGGEYFYGTHYMHLGVVLFYMLRVDPFVLFSIYFNKGWDHPNRLFFDISEAWISAAYLSPSDVKEVVPQLFVVPEILSNVSNLPLTETTEEKPIQDVKLANWSRDSWDFAAKMRRVLESTIVSNGITDWIDLIFGYKSRGDASVQAKNVYHSLCYAEEDDQLETEDTIEREAEVTFVINFGQCAQILFKTPHTPRGDVVPVKHLMTDPSLIIHQKLNNKAFTWPINDLRVTSQFISTDGALSVLVPPLFDSCITYDRQRESFVRISQSNTGDLSTKISKGVVLAPVNFSVGQVKASTDGSLVGVVQREGSFALFACSYNRYELTALSLHRHISAVFDVADFAISPTHFMCAFAIRETVVRYDIGLNKRSEPILVGSQVNKISIDDRAARIVAGCLSDIVVFSINGEEIARKTIDTPVTALDIADLNEYVDNRFFVTGHAKGDIMFWCLDLSKHELICLKKMRILEQPVLHVSIDPSSIRAVAATSSGCFSLDFYGSPARDPKKDFACECSNCGSPLDQRPKVCSVCHRFFCALCSAEDESRTILDSLCQHCSLLKGLI